MKIVLISHFGLADGMKNTLTYFTEDAEKILSINAYTNDVDPKEELEKVLSSVDTSEHVIIFSDILGGSVNQYTLPYLSRPNTYVFTGMNLPMVLQALFLTDASSSEEILGLEKTGKDAVVSMNTYTFEGFSEEDE